MGDGSAVAVQAECDRRLHTLNCDSSPRATGATSFDHLLWALSLLRHFRHQEERLGGDEAGIRHGAAGEVAVGQTTKRKADVEPFVAEDEEDTETENAGAEKTARGEHSSPSQPNNDTRAGEGTKSEPDPERHKGDANVDSLEEVVRRADSGKVGIRMAQIVGIWIGRRECHALVHLIDHCLSKSLNQVSPFKSEVVDTLPEGVVGRGEVSNEEEGAQSPSGSLWLHKWLVREVMQNDASSHRSSLDWLVAHLTAASPSLFLGAVIDDLWENVTASSASSTVPLAIYVRRIGVLEYAALRGSEQVAVELQRIFSKMGFVGSPKGEGRTNGDLQPHEQKRLVEMWSMWLVTATLCPKLLAACSRHWVPCLTVQTFESCNSLFVDVINVKSPLTSLWSILEGVDQEEPKRLSAWLSAILSRRIRELAPVGTALIVLLNRLVGLSSSAWSPEEAVGILSYANFVPGFRGILKQRFSDFIVNEVDLGGNVTHLTDLEAPSPERVQAVKVSEHTLGEAIEEKEEKKEKGAQSLRDDFSADVLAFEEIAGESNAKVLEDLLLQIANCKGEPVNPVLLAPDDDKIHRGIIHNFFKSRLTFLTSDTVDGPTSTEKCIRLRHQIGNRGGGNRFQKRGREHGGRGFGRDWDSKRQKPNEGDQPYDARGLDGWPSDRPKFLQFYLYKENKDTQDALTVIGRMLHVQPKSFGFAGTKDKRAITTQQITVFKQSAAKLAALNQRLFGIKVGNFSYVSKALVLGMLCGNRFLITLRGVVAESDQTIENAVKALGESGFINYFGLQRFGSGSIATHSVGAALLRGEWKAAAGLILSPREGDHEEVKIAREYFKKTGNVDGALQRFPRYLTAERALLTCLKRDSKNYLQAINTIPRTLRLMYVHSYQSFLWNHAASFRAKIHGVDKVVVGDLVYDKKAQDTAEELDKPKANIVDFSGGVTEVILDDVVDADVPAEARNEIKCLTVEDVESRKYNIWDVLLPLPGGSTLYPANGTADVYHNLAQKDSVDLHTCIHNVKEFALPQLPGAYRRFLQKPADLDWKILKYTDPTKALAETDLDRFQKKSSEEMAKNSTDLGMSEQTAAQLSFTLPASSYATMALRELMKISTSVAFHKTLNDEPAVTTTVKAI